MAAYQLAGEYAVHLRAVLVQADDLHGLAAVVYLVGMASRAVTEEASQRCAS